MTNLRNVEIKANCHNPDHVRAVLDEHQAEFKGTDQQIDTYFQVSDGRLKLREGTIENHLIHYERPDQAKPKQADIKLYDTEPNTPLKQILSEAIGVLCTVEKEREIYFIDHVKFHIDDVRHLGTFIEIEVIDRDQIRDTSTLRKQCRNYMDLLQISEEDLVNCSYSDMIMEKTQE